LVSESRNPNGFSKSVSAKEFCLSSVVRWSYESKDIAEAFRSFKR